MSSDDGYMYGFGDGIEDDQTSEESSSSLSTSSSVSDGGSGMSDWSEMTDEEEMLRFYTCPVCEAEEDATVACSRCKTRLYCSEDCLEKHAEEHKAMCFDMEALPVLPDLVLLEVFRHLNIRQLLRLRQVCRRFRELALHPSLWKEREVMALSGDKMMFAVMAVAPCLKRLHLTFRSRRFLYVGEEEEPAEPLFASSCAVERLRIGVRKGSGDGALRFVQRQASLGRLRSLRLHMDADWPKTLSSDQLGALVGAEGVEELFVSQRQATSTLPAASIPNPTPLRKLTYCCCQRDPLLRQLVTLHAATLEDLSIRRTRFELLPASLLTPLPRLRRLECPLPDDMTVLLQSSRLSSVRVEEPVSTMDVSGHCKAAASIASFLRAAQQLAEFHVVFGPDQLCGAPMLDMATALAAPSKTCAAVRRLTIAFHQSGEWRNPSYNSYALFMQRLAGALPWLPRLSTLELQDTRREPPAQFLRAVTPASAPCLRTLRIHLPPGCPHAWLHRADSRRLFDDNPQLHVLLRVRPGSRYLADDEVCGPCHLEGGCHPELRQCGKEVADGLLGLYSHSGSKQCEFDQGPVTWVRV